MRNGLLKNNVKSPPYIGYSFNGRGTRTATQKNWKSQKEGKNYKSVVLLGFDIKIAHSRKELYNKTIIYYYY